MDRDLRHASLIAWLVVAAAWAGCSNGQPVRDTNVAPGPLKAVAPSGETAWPFTFRWEGAQPDSVVRIRVVDEAERLILAFDARGTSAPAPDSLRAQLRPATRYQWSVAYPQADDESAAAPLEEFTVRP
jgi:hypothetical protein